MTTKHPVERGGERRGHFERAAEYASNVASSPVFFSCCVALVVVWALSYLLGWPLNARDFLGDLLAAVTLALVALLKNAERRSEHAVQYKLDAIAQAMLDQIREAGDGGVEDLERAIGRHKEV